MYDGFYSLIELENEAKQLEEEIERLERRNDILNDAVEYLMLLRVYLSRNDE